ncbi:MAG TPA: hypothetical protein VMG35_00130 [Bryobacteraceae bacterium]|nr:hypothetical protein [Bryobacteraceae bacterium]
MAMRSRTTFKKRQKELARQEKQRDKAARRVQRKLEKSQGVGAGLTEAGLTEDGMEDSLEEGLAEQGDDILGPVATPSNASDPHPPREVN